MTRARTVLAAWDRFWFAPRSSSPLAVIRISMALILLAWAAGLAPDLFNFFGPDGIVPRQPPYGRNGDTGMWSVLGANPGSTWIVIVYVAFVIAVLCLLVGFHTRLASVVTFAVLVSFTRRTPFIFNSGDALLRNLAFYLMLAPAGAAISVDRWRKTRRSDASFWEFPATASWPVRLMQIQLSVGYLAAFWAKTGGGTWRSGTAVTYALRVDFISRLPLPDALRDSLLWSNLLGYATLGMELALALFLWNRRIRPWLLAAGVGLHLSIDYAVRVGFFSYGMLVLYLAFIPAESMDAWIRRTVEWFRRRRPGSKSASDDVAAPPETAEVEAAVPS